MVRDTVTAMYLIRPQTLDDASPTGGATEASS